MIPSRLSCATGWERARVRAEDVQPGNDPGRQLATASVRRRPILWQILIGLGFLGALAAGFAAGILIMIKRDGKETKIEVPDGSNARITADGQLEVTLPGQTKSAEEARKPTESSVPDEKAIQGTWEVVSSTFKLLEVLPGEEDVPHEQVLKTTKVIITADTLKIIGAHVTNMAFDYKLRPAANPKMIDLESRNGVSWGIYQLAGSELKICTSGIGHPSQESRLQRPSEFWAELGSGKELLVLRKVGDASLTADEKAILGTWQVERLVIPGNYDSTYGFSRRDRDQRVVFSSHTMKFVGRQDRMRGGDGDSLLQDVSYALDPTDQPKRIDFVGYLMVTAHAIYDLRGDQLTLVYPCPSRQNTARPSKLAAGPDTAMVVLKRVAETTEKAPGQESAPGKPAAESPAVNPAAEAKALEGRWKVVRVEMAQNADASLAAMVGFNGNHESPANLGLGSLNIRDGDSEIFDYTKIASSRCNYVIDPTQATKTIDLTKGRRGAGPRGSVTMLGIYEIDGDRLKLCLARQLPEVKTEQRPRQFAIEPGSGNILLTLDRDHPSDDEKPFEGQWSVISWIRDGSPANLQHLTAACDDRTFAIRFQERGGGWYSVLGGSFVLDTAKQPKTISMLAMLESVAGLATHELLGIYKFEQDRLTIAYRLNGPRPDKFASTPGSGINLLVLERPKAPAGVVGAEPPGALVHATSAAAVPPEATAAPPEVAVVHPTVRQITHHLDFIGQLEAAQTAEVRSRVTGQLAKILFKPSAMVTKGEVLLEIDPAPFQAEQNKREADVRLAQLRVDRAKLWRAGNPHGPNREAALTAAKEGLKLAQLNLASTRLTAPISGRIGRPLIAAGSLVTDSMVLATIDSVDPMCVVFNVDQNSVLNLRRNPPHVHGESALPVLVGLPDEKDFPRKTKVESADTRIDPATGTARWRALLPNPDGLLMPGMFVHVRLVTSDPYQALLVPQKAYFSKSLISDVKTPSVHISADSRQAAVFIVTEKNIVQGRDVEIGPRDDDGMRVVEKGLSPDDWVAENGMYAAAAATRNATLLLQGMTVKPLKTPAAVPPALPKEKTPATGPAAKMK